jgi:hypothetical protein
MRKRFVAPRIVLALLIISLVRPQTVLPQSGAAILAVVDLTLMLSLAETTPGSHLCASGILPSTVVSFVTVP